jgi:hypothetical protein
MVMYTSKMWKTIVPEENEDVQLFDQSDIITVEGKPMHKTTNDFEIYDEIEKIWSNKFKDALQNGKILFAGPQYRLSNHRRFKNKLLLELGNTDYREFLGTNVAHPEWLGKYGKEYMSNALAICSVIETSDDKIVVGKRSDKLAEYASWFHTVGGHPNPRNYHGAKDCDLFHAMRHELRGEIGLKDKEISYQRVLGLVENTGTHKPELVFITKTSMPSYDIPLRRKSEREEHTKLMAISPRKLSFFLKKNTGNIVPPGEAGFVLYGRVRYGESWVKRLGYIKRC